jgi:hypothetical protein
LSGGARDGLGFLAGGLNPSNLGKTKKFMPTPQKRVEEQSCSLSKTSDEGRIPSYKSTTLYQEYRHRYGNKPDRVILEICKVFSSRHLQTSLRDTIQLDFTNRFFESYPTEILLTPIDMLNEKSSRQFSSLVKGPNEMTNFSKGFELLVLFAILNEYYVSHPDDISIEHALRIENVYDLLMEGFDDYE